ncbi:putative bifunctional diguanylate cyclase/phosphodiesterase [Natronoglycomyces albus]|uniref:GGDEF domain-containing protein n=1 Tax=Natronoglycomyces albus TaxID=2811108 RepID=A0A895XMH8_9ACTN|nr:GGDEF domain-containing protein [Natronoglycomyces albus]QSB04743.1 GGDEF domain-containing protein [Natronoglycomyces albus]
MSENFSRQRVRVTTWAMAVVVSLGAAGMLVGFWRPGEGVGLPQAAFFVLATIGAHALYIQADMRRQTIAFNAVDISLCLALFFLPPFWVIATRVLGSFVYYLSRYLRKRTVAIKAVYNVASAGVQTGSAVIVVLLIGLEGAHDPRTWLAFIVASCVSSMVGWMLITAVLCVLEGWRQALTGWPGLLIGFAVSTVNAIIATIIVISLGATWWALIPLAALVVATAATYRSFMDLRRQRRLLGELNDFTRLVSESMQDNRVLDAMLGQLRRLLSAEAATVWVPAESRFGEVSLTATVDETGLTDLGTVPDEALQHVVDTGSSLLVYPTKRPDEWRDLFAGSGITEAMMVPLRSGNQIYGCLAVTNRFGGDLTRFRDSDLAMLETIAAHISIAVDNTRLIDQLRYDAYHDSLTGLANRRRTRQAIEEALDITVKDEVVAVLMFDVDGMREVNDAVGHEAGDQLLLEFSRRLKELAPDGCFIGRIDSDEFILQTRLPSREDATALAQRLHEEIMAPFHFEGLTVDIGAAIGVVTHPDFASSADELLQRADTATQVAKNLDGGVQTYLASLESESLRRLGLAADLRRALDRDELEVHYQPKIDLSTGKLVGVECLARWNHPNYGPVSPAEFIPVAGDTGQLGRLTMLVLRQALVAARAWSREDDPMSVAVNLSPKTLADLSFPDRVAAYLAEFEVEPSQLTFEITEDVMVSDRSRLLPNLDRLHELGVQLSVDDFGTGYSSLAYLRRLPVQEVKIDLRFVQGMTTDEGDRAIVRAVLDLARHFSLTVVAEGVESAMTLEELTAIGCDIGQGNYFSHPLPAERFVAWRETLESGHEGGPSRWVGRPTS